MVLCREHYSPALKTTEVKSKYLKEIDWLSVKRNSEQTQISHKITAIKKKEKKNPSGPCEMIKYF